ncbi:hypothetical protein AAC387_Pa08g1287 [Persea americana]
MKLIRKGITTYEYVVAMRAMSEAPAGSIDDDNQNVIYSPSGSATTGFSGGSSLGLQYKGAWCTPPRVFVDHQLRTLQGGHRALVGLLYWNKHILTIEGKDLIIIDNDVRISCMVASAAGDETLRIWNVFETPEVAKLTTGTTCAGPFSYLNDIR